MNNSAIAFTIFGFEVYWYGLVYVFGFLLAYYYFLKFFRTKDLSEDDKDWSFLILLVSSIVGARLFYTLAYNPLYYLTNFIDIFKINEGGMSIHGGFIGFLVGSYIVSKKFNFSIYKLTDFFTLPALIALSFGRLGNFFNQELVGVSTQSSLGMVFPEYDSLKRYPYQLFAGAKNLIVFQIIFYLYLFKQLKDGVVTVTAFLLYSLGRFFLDFIREPTTLFLSFPLGQWLSLIVIVISSYLLYLIYTDTTKYKTKGFILILDKDNKNNKNNLNNKKEKKGKKYKK